MLNLKKETEKAIQTKAITREELVKALITECNIFDLADALAEYMMKDREVQTQIAVTQEDYDRIVGMFRVKGQRFVDGNYIQETRGRKPKVQYNQED